MDAKLWCSAVSSATEGSFMWEYEQSGGFAKVAIKNGSTLQEWYRAKVYDEDKATGILSNNLTKNEKFFGRVNITSDGSLIVMNSTVQDSGNYKCSYQGTTGPVEESLVQLRVKPFKATYADDMSVEITKKPTTQISEATSDRRMEVTSNPTSGTGNNNTSCSLNGTKGNNTDHKNGDDTGSPNSDTNSSSKILATVFIVLCFLLAIALGVVSYKLYLARCERHQSIPQVDNADDREESCVANGSTVRYVNSPAINGSPCINRTVRNEGNRATNGTNGSSCIDKSNGSEGNLVENGCTAEIV